MQYHHIRNAYIPENELLDSYYEVELFLKTVLKIFRMFQ